MAEATRTDVPGRNIYYPAGSPETQAPTAAGMDEPQLPESARPSSNPALNRSAEVVGRSVGTAMAGVRRLPQQLDKLRSRIHLVPERERVGETISEIRDSAVETAADWCDAAEDSIAELKDRAEAYRHEVAERSHQGWEALQRQTEWRIVVLRRSARSWLAAARQWESERPLQVIGSCAVAAFVAGGAIRIWRSNRA